MHAWSKVLFAGLCTVMGCGETLDTQIGIVRIAPVADPECGVFQAATSMTVRALGDFAPSESTAESIVLGTSGNFDIRRFPTSTEMIEVEVRGQGGVLAVGRSHVFRIEELAKGAEIPVFLAPINGMCGTGPMQLPVTESQLVRTNNSVLVIGGTLGDGTPTALVQRYDAQTASFTTLAAPLYGDSSSLGLTGASATELSGGDVVVVGGNVTAYQVYSSNTGTFSPPAFYREVRGRHTAIALGERKVFLAGGCSQIREDGCEPGSELRTSSILDTTTGALEAGPSLSIPRLGGTAWIESNDTIVLVGGVNTEGDAVTTAERLFLSGAPSQEIEKFSGHSVQTSAGSLWANSASGTLSVLPPLALSATALTKLEPGGALLQLQTGDVLAYGAETFRRVRGLDGARESLPSPMEDLSAFRAILLADGSVLFVGGTSAPEAKVFRPRLTGPLSPSASASFSSRERSEGVSMSSPQQASVQSGQPDYLRITTGPQGEEWMLFAGPEYKKLKFSAIAASETGSLLLLLGWKSSQDHLRVLLRSNSEIVVLQREDGVDAPVQDCSGQLGPDALSETEQREIVVTLQGRALHLQVAGETVLACDLTLPVSGKVGIGVLGQTGSSLRLDIATADRLQLP